MAQAYIRDHETNESIWVDLPPSFFEHILRNSQLIGEIGVDIRDRVTGIMEYHLVSRKDIEPIH